MGCAACVPASVPCQEFAIMMGAEDGEPDNKEIDNDDTQDGAADSADAMAKEERILQNLRENETLLAANLD